MSEKLASDKIYTFANVLFRESDEFTYCYIADEEIHAGDLAIVGTADGLKYTLVAYLTRATADNAPYPFGKLKHIQGRVAKNSEKFNDIYKKFFAPAPRHDDSFYPDDDWPDD